MKVSPEDFSLPQLWLCDSLLRPAGFYGTRGPPSLVALEDFVTFQLSVRNPVRPPKQNESDTAPGHSFAPGMQESELGLVIY